jgi:protein-S-isoprenylcysteine O-methyltransferase Ste14
MDTLRFVAGLVVWATVLPAILYWYLIHPFSGYWRSVGPARTYMVVVPLALLMVGFLLRYQAPLVASDLGLSYPLFYSGLILWIAAILLDRRIRRLLDVRTLFGEPQLTPRGPDDPEPVLLDQGVYGVIRHPRYVAVFLGALGWATMSNYGAAYVVAVVAGALLLGLIPLEERELVERFGDRYREYRRRVPAVIPRLGSPDAG